MDQEPGFYKAERAIEPLLRPLHNFGLSGLERTEEGVAPDEQAVEVGDRNVEEVEEGEARTPAVPHDPGRPIRKEWMEHLPRHWPFRSWCRHCVCGRGFSSPHKSRTDEGGDFGRGRISTMSMDHCFVGALNREKPAHDNLRLVFCQRDGGDARHCSS